MRDPGVFLYDGECGFCGASARLLRDRARPRGIDIRPWQQTDLAPLGVTEQQCREAAALVTVDASGAPRACFGAEAIAGALRAGRLAWPLVGLALQAPGVRVLSRIVYAWVARNRHRLRTPFR
ncbi:MAG: DCC1-like thiol-disulfide oxidoreductase family protein [Dermatophilus congolensis]|nr:DCC1-like thiol-disulfide oxidoreductase family protein [Dermatophilus congolensis]